ncbi:MAG: septum formation family protein [Actinomycetales bacterium]
MTRPLLVAASALAAVVLTGCNGQTSDPYQLSVGQCLLNADTTGLVDEVDSVECSEPHAAEVFASITAQSTADSPDTYPGKDDLERQAGACAARFADFIGKPYEESDLEITYFHPTEDSWDRGDRQILCIVSVPTGTVTGSLEGSTR